MYFVPESKLGKYETSENLEKGVKFMKQIDVGDHENEGTAKVVEYLRCFNKSFDNTLSYIKQIFNESRHFTHYKLTYDGLVTKHQKILDVFYSQPYLGCGYVLENIPLIFYYNITGSKTRIKLYLLGIPGSYLENVDSREASVKLDFPFYLSATTCSLDCIVFTILNRNDNTCWILVLQVQVSNVNNCELIEIWRKNLNQCIRNLENVYSIIKAESKLFLQYRKVGGNDVDGCILDLHTEDLIDLPAKFTLDCGVTYFVKCYNQYFVINLILSENKIQIFRCQRKTRCRSQSIYFNFESVGHCKLKCMINRKYRIFLLVADCDNSRVQMFDLLDSSNKALLYQGYNNARMDLCFSETGEEMYFYQRNKVTVCFYRCPIKSLLSLAVDFVCELYSKKELKEINLPKQLHQYIWEGA